jgi:carbonic anhydrase/acetyltransferase-like protein (isoleucine patch superfamily)
MRHGSPAMTVTGFEGKTPRLGARAWVHPLADVLGDVILGRDCWVGPGARLRGDYGAIVVGDCCAVEDDCVVHLSARILERSVDEEHRAAWRRCKHIHVGLRERYRAGLGR